MAGELGQGLLACGFASHERDEVFRRVAGRDGHAECFHALAERLAPGGYLHAATDWEEYALEMLSTLNAEPLLANSTTEFAPRPAYRPLTKFERRGLARGYGVWDLIFRRRKDRETGTISIRGES